MKNEFKGFSKVFSFTFRQHGKNKGYLTTTIIIGLLCLLLPAIIMVAVDHFGGDEEEAVEYITEKVSEVYVIDKTPGEEVDYSILNTINDKSFSAISYKNYEDIDTAGRDARGSEGTLIMLIEPEDNRNVINILLPEESKLSEDDAYAYNSFIGSYFQMIMVQKSGLDYEQVQDLTRPIVGDAISEEEAISLDGSKNELDMVKDVFSIALPYLTIMVLYFMILAYGQGVANSVIMEKNSKLVDTFLITVKPTAVILGKVLAIFLTGILQLFSWIVALIISFTVGIAIVNWMNPSTEMVLIQFFDSFGSVSGLFSPGGIILAILIILAGFLLYCGLAAIGGAMASKPEDLPVTNLLFTWALVISFFACLYGGVMEGSLTGSSWQAFVPFTSMMVVPGMALLGDISVMGALISFAILLITTLIIVWLAGKIYVMLIFYRGNSIPIGKVFKMVKSKK
ncbi:ABC transporter permease [Alloiococcus sp. CFN-8]|uniref:ABC transporter permease n=1 Tax=Alloiococcus sp. CFN-8 TaxID=3416081 RepID=UPI003CF7B435